MGAYPWASSSVFPMEENLICCICGCWFTLPSLPSHGYEDPYTSLTEAQDAIANEVAGCLVHHSAALAGLVTAAVTANVLDITFSVPSAPLAGNFNMRLYLAGAVDIDFSFTFDVSANASGTFTLYQDDGSTIDASDSYTPGAETTTHTGTVTLTPSVPGYYYLSVSLGEAPGLGSPTEITAGSVSVDGGATMRLCAVRAAWDNSGSTAYEVCT